MTRLENYKEIKELERIGNIKFKKVYYPHLDKFIEDLKNE